MRAGRELGTGRVHEGMHLMHLVLDFAQVQVQGLVPLDGGLGSLMGPGLPAKGFGCFPDSCLHME